MAQNIVYVKFPEIYGKFLALATKIVVQLVSSHGRERACHRRLSEFRCRIINDDAQPQVMTTEETLAVSGLLSRQPSTIFEESLLIPLLLTGDKSSSSSMVDIKVINFKIIYPIVFRIMYTSFFICL
jgi:hypothetical protein